MSARREDADRARPPRGWAAGRYGRPLPEGVSRVSPCPLKSPRPGTKGHRGQGFCREYRPASAAQLAIGSHPLQGLLRELVAHVRDLGCLLRREGAVRADGLEQLSARLAERYSAASPRQRPGAGVRLRTSARAPARRCRGRSTWSVASAGRGRASRRRSCRPPPPCRTSLARSPRSPTPRPCACGTGPRRRCRGRSRDLRGRARRRRSQRGQKSDRSLTRGRILGQTSTGRAGRPGDRRATRRACRYRPRPGAATRSRAPDRRVAPRHRAASEGATAGGAVNPRARGTARRRPRPGSSRGRGHRRRRRSRARAPSRTCRAWSAAHERESLGGQPFDRRTAERDGWYSEHAAAVMQLVGRSRLRCSQVVAR